jgi:hypothetical protein
MIGKNGERWKAVCEMAATEQDPDKLRALITEIDALLGAKYDRLDAKVHPEAHKADTDKNDNASNVSNPNLKL